MFGVKTALKAAFVSLAMASASVSLSADPEKIIDCNQVYYAVNRNSGFEVSRDRGRTWTEMNMGLPDRIVYPFDALSKRNLTSFSLNADNTAIFSATTIDSLFVTMDSGSVWKEVKLKNPVKKSAYITASSIRGETGSDILLGTSFSGLFESEDGGRSWKSLAGISGQFFRGAGFHDDISAVTYGKDTSSFYMASGFSGKIFNYAGTGRSRSGGKWSEIDVPVKIGEKICGNGITSLFFDRSSGTLEVYSGRYLFFYDTQKGTWKAEPVLLPLREKKEGNGKKERKERASQKRGIYLSSVNAANLKIDEYFSFLVKHNLNSVVVDFKDDNGFVTYSTKNAVAHSADAVRRHINITDFLSKAHQNGIYVIARIVVFKDKQLFSHDSNRYAVWDRTTDTPWGYFVKSGADENSLEQKEFWTDPYSEFVWDYNISIALELQNLGVDEIQFDYIRFPTDGDIDNIKYRFRREGMSRSEALESFLVKAREKITIPLSTDLYGFNAWYKKGNWNGQQIDMFADYVDVICPMFYPSHFPAPFLGSMEFTERAEKIYREGTARARKIAGERSIVRPYVQAFLIGAERNLEQPEYSRYLNMQIKGLYDAGSSGFTLWNASGIYYMVSDSMMDFVKIDKDAKKKSNPFSLYQ